VRFRPDQVLQLRELCGVTGGEVVGLGEVIGQVVQLPGVVVGVVGAGGEPGQGGRCPVPGDAVEFGACPPPVFVDRPVAQRLEVLHRVTLGGARVLEGVGEAGAVHGFLFGPVHDLRLRDAGRLQDGGADVGAVGELGAPAT